jgi:hypothetical protein
MLHVLVGDDDLVLVGHVVGQPVVHDQPQQPAEERQAHLVIQGLGLRLQHHQIGGELTKGKELCQCRVAMMALSEDSSRLVKPYHVVEGAGTCTVAASA